MEIGEAFRIKNRGSVHYLVLLLERDGWIKRVREVKDPKTTRLREGDEVMAILAVFICGLMVGRTPELLGKKISARQMTFVAPMVRASSASTRSFVAYGLRFGSSCTVSVTRTVPSPSTWIAPPSFTSIEGMRSAPARSVTNPAIASSPSPLAHSVAPQPLKIQSTPPSVPRSSNTKVGPVSRIQNSWSGVSTTSISAER